MDRESLQREMERLQRRQQILRGELDRMESDLQRCQREIGNIEEPSPPRPSPETPPEVLPVPKPAEPPPPPKLNPDLTFASAVPASTPSTERPSQEPPPLPPPVAPITPGDSFELRLGRDWLVRIGMVVLLAGLVFLVGFLYQEYAGAVGPAVRLFFLYLGAFALLGLGWFLEQRHLVTKEYARVVLAGGFAAVYAVTYASHSYEAVRIISEPSVAGALLLGWTAVMLWIATWRQAQEIALLGILFGFYTTAIHPLGFLALFCNLMLVGAGAFFISRYPWKFFGLAALAGAYAGLLYWQLFLPTDTGGPGDLSGVTAMIYWLLFAMAGVLAKRTGFGDGARAAFLTINLVLAFSVAALLEAPAADEFWKLSGIFALLAAFQAGLLWHRQPASTRSLELSLMAVAALSAISLISRAAGPMIPVVLGLEVLLLAGAARVSKAWWLAPGTLILAALAGGYWLADVVIEGSIAYYHTAGLGLLLVGASLLLKPSGSGRLQAVSAWGLGVGGIIIYSILLVDTAAPGGAALLLSAFAAVLILSYALLRAPALVHLSVIPMFFAAVVGGVDQFLGPGISLAHGLLILALLLGISHLPDGGRWVLPKENAVWRGAVALAMGWLVSLALIQHGTEGRWLAAVPFLGWLLVLHAHKWERPALALAAIPAFFLALNGFVRFLSSDPPGIWFGAVPWAALALTGLHLSGCSRLPKATALASFCFGLAAVLYPVWVFAWAEPAHWVVLLGAAVALLGMVSPRDSLPSRAPVMLLYAVLATGSYVLLSDIGVEKTSWWNVAGALLILLGHQFVERAEPKREEVLALARISAGLAVFLLLFFISRWSISADSSFVMTAGWSALAFFLLVLGFALPDRIYRWFGLIVLGLALARVLLVDVWMLEAIYRILSFLSLGAVLLVIGFLYNRYQETIRKWL